MSTERLPNITSMTNTDQIVTRQIFADGEPLFAEVTELQTGMPEVFENDQSIFDQDVLRTEIAEEEDNIEYMKISPRGWGAVWGFLTIVDAGVGAWVASEHGPAPGAIAATAAFLGTTAFTEAHRRLDIRKNIPLTRRAVGRLAILKTILKNQEELYPDHSVESDSSDN